MTTLLLRPLPAPAAALGGLLALALAGGAQDALDGEAIVRRADRDHRSKDERGVVEMVLVAEGSPPQRREMEVLSKTGQGEDDMNMMRFLSPPNVRGTAVLTVEATGRADDQWVYLPALKKSKRIATGQRKERFSGTDFTYEDLRTEDFARTSYKLDGEGQVQTEKDGPQIACHVVEATPKDADASGYSKRRLFVDKARFLILKVEYFDKQGRHQKTWTGRDFTQVEGHWRPSQSMMEDHLRNTKTVMRFTERKINPGLPDATFTEAALERGL